MNNIVIPRLIWGSYIALLFAVSLLLLMPRVVFDVPRVGLDPSYGIGMSLAIRDNLVHGQDVIVYNLGLKSPPLGRHCKKLVAAF